MSVRSSDHPDDRPEHAAADLRRSAPAGPVSATDPSAFRYFPRYCEENVWHLAQDPMFTGCAATVAVISNSAGACLFWDQQMCPEPDLPVWWDYHVILLVRRERWLVYDLDSILPLPVDAGTYLSRTFRMQERMPEVFRPRFILIDGGDYVDNFASDRSHMRDEDGGWLSPPPDWPAIHGERGEGFPLLIDRQLRAGAHISLSEMHARFGGGAFEETLAISEGLL